MKNINLVKENTIKNVNHMLIGGGLEKTYKISNYEEF